jgi:hypothetical protein
MFGGCHAEQREAALTFERAASLCSAVLHRVQDGFEACFSVNDQATDPLMLC